MRDVGFTASVSQRLAAQFEGDVIRNQILWIDDRQPSRNRLGLLRRAIEENWPAPEKRPDDRGADSFATVYYASVVGAEGSSVAIPSRNDLVAASRFLARATNEPDLTPEPLARAFAELVRARLSNDPVARRSLTVALRQLGDTFWMERSRQTLARQHQRVVQAKQQHRDSLAADIEAWVEDRFSRCSATELAALRKSVIADYGPLTRGLEDADPRSHPRLSRLIRGVLSQQCPLRD